MSQNALRARYLGDSVNTASPARLLVMLYDRLALDLERAEEFIVSRDRMAANEQLLHAQSIVLELQSSLNVDVWDGAANLSSLYSWLHSELIRANVEQSTQKVTSCRQIVEPLRTAWAEAAATAGQS